MFKSTSIGWNSCILFTGLLALMLWTSCLMPLTWDEGNAIMRSEKIGHWLSLFWSRDAQSPSPFDSETIDKYCEQTTQAEGHPAGYVLLIAAGNSFVQATSLSSLLDEKTCYRFGAIFLFCIALTAVFIRVGKTFNLIAGILCVLCIVLMPRVFAHAHIAACDSPLMSCWLLAWALFDTALKNKRGAFLWGIAIGLGVSMKFPGWIIPIPFMVFAAWELLWQRPFEKIAQALVIGFSTALVVFFMTNPNLWHSPVAGFADFISLNTHRETNYNIPIAFLGTRYSLLEPLPWYNTLFWAAITIPSGFLFFLICFFFGWRNGFEKFEEFEVFYPCSEEEIARKRLVFLTVLNFIPLMIIRALPDMPVHDGVRLFVAAFPFAGIMAGLGALWLWKPKRYNDPDLASQNRPSFVFYDTTYIDRPSSYKHRRILVICILLGTGFNLYWYAPQWLSYYNLCIGGLPGAVRSGMEATYYWDSLDDTTMDWINKHAGEYATDPASCTISFSNNSRDTLRLLTRWGKLKVPCVNQELSSNTSLVVFQCRAGLLYDEENELFRTSKPVYRKALNRYGLGPWELYRVPLLKIYKAKDYIRVLAEDSAIPLDKKEKVDPVPQPNTEKATPSQPVETKQKQTGSSTKQQAP